MLKSKVAVNNITNISKDTNVILCCVGEPFCSNSATKHLESVKRLAYFLFLDILITAKNVLEISYPQT